MAGKERAMHDRLFKRLQKKAKKGMRGWPVATIAFYGPDLSRASKVAVGVIPHESASPQEMRAWTLETGDVRSDPVIATEIIEFIEAYGARSVAISDGIIGCPHQEGIDYEGEWCPFCAFWHGRDRFTGKLVH
jgi:hypothetical protein